MKARHTLLLMAVALASGMVIAGCQRSLVNQVSKENYDKIHNDMTIAEVKQVLGEPTETNTGASSFLGIDVSGTTMKWRSGQNLITVGFVNDKVIRKDFSQVDPNSR